MANMEVIVNSSYEEVFDEMSAQSLDTSTTDGGNSFEGVTKIVHIPK